MRHNRAVDTCHGRLYTEVTLGLRRVPTSEPCAGPTRTGRLGRAAIHRRVQCLPVVRVPARASERITVSLIAVQCQSPCTRALAGTGLRTAPNP